MTESIESVLLPTMSWGLWIHWGSLYFCFNYMNRLRARTRTMVYGLLTERYEGAAKLELYVSTDVYEETF